MFFQERKRIAQLAARARLSAVYGFREHVDAGGLINYGVNLADNFRRANFELIINLKTSKALGGRPFPDTCQRPLCATSGPSPVRVNNRLGQCSGSLGQKTWVVASRGQLKLPCAPLHNP